MSKSTWSRSHGLVAGMERSMTGMISAPKLRGLTIGAPPRTFSECRCFRTIWRTPSPSLAFRAKIDVLPVLTADQQLWSAHDSRPRERSMVLVFRYSRFPPRPNLACHRRNRRPTFGGARGTRFRGWRDKTGPGPVRDAAAKRFSKLLAIPRSSIAVLGDWRTI